MPLHVSPMTQLHEARVEDDNWTGITSAAERKKRQNRLHQRAWRRKKAAERTAVDRLEPAEPPQYASHSPAQPPGPDLDDLLDREILELLSVSPCVSYVHDRLKPFSYWDEVHEQLDNLNTARGVSANSCFHSGQYLGHTYGLRRNMHDDRRLAIPPVIPYISSSEQATSTIPEIPFPLSADHRLLVLIQYNVLRAFITNMSIMSLLERMPLECGMALNIKNLPPPPETIPPCLEPTQLQAQMAHDLWIDIIPWPEMRDNLLLSHGTYDEEDLCVDMLGGLYEGFDEIETRGLIVWGEPWSETGWEVTEGFATRWSFLLKGCHALVESTNTWRESRGEERLLIEV